MVAAHSSFCQDSFPFATNLVSPVTCQPPASIPNRSQRQHRYAGPSSRKCTDLPLPPGTFAKKFLLSLKEGASTLFPLRGPEETSGPLPPQDKPSPPLSHASTPPSLSFFLNPPCASPRPLHLKYRHRSLSDGPASRQRLALAAGPKPLVFPRSDDRFEPSFHAPPSRSTLCLEMPIPLLNLRSHHPPRHLASDRPALEPSPPTFAPQSFQGSPFFSSHRRKLNLNPSSFLCPR